MKKSSAGFVCQGCSHSSPKWLGKCPNCEAWNTFVPEQAEKGLAQKKLSKERDNQARALLQIPDIEEQRIVTGVKEFDRVLGGGITKGSLILLGGEPGVGKSTLLSLVLAKVSSNNEGTRVLYVSGEESQAQVGARMKRMDISSEHIYLFHENSWQVIKSEIEILKPHFLVIDSIQTTISEEVDSIPGSVSQIREVTHEIMNYTKAKGITSFLIGHITKEGSIAGPKILEHMVDTVIYFEGDELGQYRIIRSIKNRFGNSNEVGIFEMSKSGLQEVENPSQLFVEQHGQKSFGISRTCIMEGSRALMVEVQALVVENKQGCGKRATQGLEGNRLSMIIAIIEKYFSVSLGFSDVYVNIAGGLRATSRESDLAIMASILSSIYKKSLPIETVFLGEVGLTGEIRASAQIEKKLKELELLGYKEVVSSKKTRDKHSSKTSLTLKGFSQAQELLGFFS